MQNKSQEFVVYPKRFLVVILFAFSQFMISVVLNTLTPIAAYLSQIYDEDPVVVNLGALLFTLMHPIFTFPASYIIDTYGTRVGIALGCLLGLLGVGLRMLINHGFAWVIIGQVVAGIGRPFILNCQAKVSANWFTADIRGGVTQILTLVLNCSLIIGILIPGLVFGGYEPNSDNLEQGKTVTFKLMAVQTIMAAICFIPNLLLQDSNPPTPPSESGLVQRQPFSQAIPKMLKNINFLLLLGAFGCYFGIFNAISIVLSYLIEPWFSGDDLPLAVAAVGGSPVLSGVIGVMIFGPMQRNSKVYKKWIIICMIGSMTAIVLFYPLLLTNSLVLVSLISAFNSFFLIPLVPIMLQLGCELVFPVGEGSAVGMLFAFGNLFGFLYGLILSVIVEGQTKMQTLWGLLFCFLIFVIGFILVYFMKEEKNRQKAENQMSERRKSLLSHTQGSQNSDNDSIRNSLLLKNDSGEDQKQNKNGSLIDNSLL